MFRCVIHWFRRDLRLTDNTALVHAAREGGSVIPAYVVRPWRGRHLWTGPARQTFLCGCLTSLSQDLPDFKGRLVIRRGDPVEELRTLAIEGRAEAIYFNRDSDPHGMEDERRLAEMCREQGLECRGYKDLVLHEPGEILKADGTPYRVYTPYSRRWLDAPKAAPAGLPGDLTTPEDLESLPLPGLSTWELPDHPGPLPEAGERAARKRLGSALESRLAGYGAARDHPAADSTSRLSQDLRFGTLSIREVHRDVREARASTRRVATRESLDMFLKELAWREFYMQILAWFPEVLALEFNPDHRGLPWNEPGLEFERWKRGETGFPIVDAGMRELAATGFMHNRVRMITAMFLTKDLHLDWRLGEQFFMQSLVDGEIASNNGGWQWSAGTGADAAPYFRIQNPWTQTKRYDPEGCYIRKWVPELADCPARALWTPPGAGESVGTGYPAPVVDHAAERLETLARFKGHSAQRGR